MNFKLNQPSWAAFGEGCYRRDISSLFAALGDINCTVIAAYLHHRSVHDHLHGDFAVNGMQGGTIESSGVDIVSDPIAANVQPDGASLTHRELRADLEKFSGDVEARAGIVSKIDRFG